MLIITGIILMIIVVAGLIIWYYKQKYFNATIQTTDEENKNKRVYSYDTIKDAVSKFVPLNIDLDQFDSATIQHPTYETIGDISVIKKRDDNRVFRVKKVNMKGKDIKLKISREKMCKRCGNERCIGKYLLHPKEMHYIPRIKEMELKACNERTFILLPSYPVLYTEFKELHVIAGPNEDIDNIQPIDVYVGDLINKEADK